MTLVHAGRGAGLILRPKSVHSEIFLQISAAFAPAVNLRTYRILAIKDLKK